MTFGIAYLSTTSITNVLLASTANLVIPTGVCSATFYALGAGGSGGNGPGGSANFFGGGGGGGAAVKSVPVTAGLSSIVVTLNPAQTAYCNSVSAACDGANTVVVFGNMTLTGGGGKSPGYRSNCVSMATCAPGGGAGGVGSGGDLNFPGGSGGTSNTFGTSVNDGQGVLPYGSAGGGGGSTNNAQSSTYESV